MNIPDWQWNEMQQVGTDYTDIHEVAVYDQRMAEFRNVHAENTEMLQTLALPKGAAVLEIGCGTGRFARAAAAAGLTVTAIDVSAIMLDYLQHQVKEESLPSITTQHAGFLTMDFPADSFDAVVSGVALHHLPDAWKYVALRHIARALKKDGQFILRDVVFMLPDAEEPEPYFSRFPDGFAEMRMEAARHIAQEYSTFDWILEGMMTRAGFEILKKSSLGEHFAVYHSRKK